MTSFEGRSESAFFGNENEMIEEGSGNARSMKKEWKCQERR